MVRIVTLLVMYLVSQLINAQTTFVREHTYVDEVVLIKVSVSNVATMEGSVKFALYTEEGFLTKPLQAKIGEINERFATVTFAEVPEGEYAIVCFHDKNANNQMDFSEKGIPIEDYGSTNNIYRMGPPTFEDAKFTVKNKSLDLEIKF